MRVKIKGEVTAERLAEALNIASEKYQVVRPGSKIYGANLYLSAFDADGQPFDLGDDRGEPVIITIEAKSGELVKPALTAEGEKRRQEAKAKQQAVRAEEEALADKEREKSLRERQDLVNRRTRARIQFESVTALTAHCLKTMPYHLVDELNKTVQTVWEELKPVERYGGQPKALPVFQIRPEGLVILSAAWKNPKKVINPVFRMQYGEPVPHWVHDAWVEVTKRIIVQLGELSKMVPDPAKA
ncbi:OfxX fusion product [Massilia sp. CCM 8695]|uniref:OfxX fusion product n=1 Tax=Massilia frigida TaxID=2609281 RepID=A0ABX0NJE7_9BURK|nr:OfxX fusion product [Massilia frigida]NHZ83989.1 OfxX fusion product [Massilia frigida]